MYDQITIADDFGVCLLTLREIIHCDSSAVPCTIHRNAGASEEITLTCRIDMLDEVDDFRHGGILHYVLRQLSAGQGLMNRLQCSSSGAAYGQGPSVGQSAAAAAAEVHDRVGILIGIGGGVAVAPGPT